MLRVAIEQAEPGMTLSMPVPNPDAAGRFLLHVGYELQRQDIQRLRERRVRDLYVRCPGLDFVAKFVSPAILERRAALAATMSTVLESTQPQASPNMRFDAYCQAVSQLVEQLLANPTAALYLDQLRGGEPSLLERSGAVAYISLLMGLKLDGYLIRQRKRLPANTAKKVNNLGVGAMLADIGVRRLPDEVRQRHGQTGDLSDRQWQDHVHIGYELVRGNVEPTAAAIVLHHHQHFDGTGFPARTTLDGQTEALSGEKIHVYARIVAVADTFCALQKPNAQTLNPTVQVIGQMLQPPTNDWLDPEVVRAFLAVVPPYPPGTLLRLNNGLYAVAIDHHASDPCRPRVQLVDNPQELAAGLQGGGELRGALVDLREYPDLIVAEAGNQPVADLNFPSLSLTLGDRAPAHPPKRKTQQTVS